MSTLLNSIRLWFDTGTVKTIQSTSEKINWLRCIPYIVIHLGALGVFFVGVSPAAIAVCFVTYALRVFTLTGFYHRYFSHRSFKTSRIAQFIFAFIGASAAQRGPLWWAAHHRHHHKHSDTELDSHSPKMSGLLHSHLLWFLKDKNFETNETYIQDLIRFPELVFINRFDIIPPVALATVLYFFGGWQFVIWGFFVSTILVYQVTFMVNSITHTVGKQRYSTNDDSKNSWWVALLTFGEGWHNNHHYYPSSARQGFFAHEIDITYYILKFLAFFGIVWELRQPPAEILDAGR